MNANEHNVIEKLNSIQPRMDLPFYLISPLYNNAMIFTMLLVTAMYSAYLNIKVAL
jgi:hypothetical protein